MAMNDDVRLVLGQLVQQEGAAVYADPRRFEALLKDLAGHRAREVFVLVAAVNAGVPGELLGASVGLESVTADRMIARLQDSYALDAEASRWAVESWAGALGLNGATAQGGPPPPSVAAAEAPGGWDSQTKTAAAPGWGSPPPPPPGPPAPPAPPPPGAPPSTRVPAWAVVGGAVVAVGVVVAIVLAISGGGGGGSGKVQLSATPTVVTTPFTTAPRVTLTTNVPLRSTDPIVQALMTTPFAPSDIPPQFDPNDIKTEETAPDTSGETAEVHIDLARNGPDDPETSLYYHVYPTTQGPRDALAGRAGAPPAGVDDPAMCNDQIGLCSAAVGRVYVWSSGYAAHGGDSADGALAGLKAGIAHLRSLPVALS